MGSLKRIDCLQKDDTVWTPDGPALIVCVVRQTIADGHCYLTSFAGGLQVTPAHPVRLEGVWLPAGDVGKTIDQQCGLTFNFVLSHGHIMLVNGVECVTLGHGFVEDGVAHHFY